MIARSGGKTSAPGKRIRVLAEEAVTRKVGLDCVATFKSNASYDKILYVYVPPS